MTTADGVCRQQYIYGKTSSTSRDRYQFYAEANYEITPNLRSHFELSYARTDIEGVNTSRRSPPRAGRASTPGPPAFDQPDHGGDGQPPTRPNILFAINPGFAAYRRNGTAAADGIVRRPVLPSAPPAFLVGRNPSFRRRVAGHQQHQ